MKIFISLALACLFSLVSNNSMATHLRAGEILSKKIGNLEYEFTVIIYRNSESPVILEEIVINFGDNTSKKLSRDALITPVNQNTAKYTFTTRYTYSAPGIFKVFMFERNRNADIINISNSVDVNFYIETQIVINPFIGQNSSPVLKVPPIDVANQGQIYTHNPGAWDADGDSLVYLLGVPKHLPDDTAIIVPGYKSLNDPSFFSANCNSSLTLDPKKGDLTWKTPCVAGLYNIVITIFEYRNGRLLGFITRDMQIEVLKFNNLPPTLQIPNDTCITAGSLLNGSITGTDAPFTQIELTAFGGAFDFSNSPASTTLKFPPGPQTTPARMFFKWQTTCQQLRQEAFNFQFRAEDNPGQLNKLATIKTWSVKLIAPKPENFRASTLNKTITLKWKKYSCSNANKIIVMRKDCASDSSKTDSCSNGYQATNGFTKIAEIAGSDTIYTDKKDLKRGALYCYRIYALFPEPTKGQSRSSNELCVILAQDVPIIFKVSADTVDGTSQTNGKVKVAWTTPKKIDSSLYTPPYSYQLWRKSTGNFVPVTQKFDYSDTTYTDIGLNTVDNSYQYFVNFLYSNQDKLYESTDTASTVFLKGFAKDKRAILNWQFDVPWDNSGKYHFIWRKVGGVFQIIDSIFVMGNSGNFTDLGQFQNTPLVNNTKYEYYVTTQGDYTCPNQKKRINIPTILRNNSNQVSVFPNDTNKPCPPTLKIFASDCNQQPIIPKIYWQPQLKAFCDSAITTYNVYYSSDNKNTFNLLTSVIASDTVYSDQSNNTPSACYYVTALNKKELESAKSNIVCSSIISDKCSDFYFELPNVFSPNGDKINDIYTPKPTPQFVQSLDFKIYNRWGTRIFSTTDININWDGANTTDGLYYYIALVGYKNSENEINSRQLKGWIQLIR